MGGWSKALNLGVGRYAGRDQGQVRAIHVGSCQLCWTSRAMSFLQIHNLKKKNRNNK